jgi:hypothetical protein
MFDFLSDIPSAIVGGGAVVGAVSAVAVKQAKRISDAKKAWKEVHDAFISLNLLSDKYRIALADDGKISPEESEYLCQTLGRLVKDTLEAREALNKVIS